MCGICGCSSQVGTENPLHPNHQHPHDPNPNHNHHHHHDHTHSHNHDSHHDNQLSKNSTTVRLEKEILTKNKKLAEKNRIWFSEKNILTLNLMSSPGAGKTTLLERTLRDLSPRIPMSVIEGDQETTLDAQRIQATGCQAVQINTGAGCHLDAEMISAGVRRLNPPDHSIVMIENVGNLVCPALFDLGEAAKAVIFSVTEGEDKPLKYPTMFRESEIMILNKIDLLPYLSFDVDRCLSFARRINPEIQIFQVSATREQGLRSWYDWLELKLSSFSLQSRPLENRIDL